MKKIFIILSLLAPFLTWGQIISSDTVCPGSTVNFTTSANATSYTWSFSNVDVIPAVPSTPTPVASGSLLNVPSFATMTNDNGNWYSFVPNYGANNIVRMSYGNSPTNTPTMISLGTFGVTGSIYGGFDIIKDSATGNWFGFGVNASQLLKLEFGASLSNTPIGSITNFPSNFAWPHGIKIQKIDNQWIGFVANRSGAITRLDFGTSIANTPTATNLPTTNYSSPVSFSLIKKNGNWYMFIADLYNPAGISRLDFGTNIQNNSPVAVYLGNFGGTLNLTRAIYVLSDCDEIYGYVLDEYGMLYSLDFNNNVTNPTPTLTNLMSLNANYLLLYMYNNELRALIETTISNTFTATVLRTFPTSTVTNYYNPSTSYTFTTPGVYDVTLWLDQGNMSGPTAFCKQIVVVPGINTFLGPDTLLCNTASYILNASNTSAGSYLWSTGATTPSIVVTQSGTYWVQITGASCAQGDTITVNFGSAPPVNIIPADTFICLGTRFSLTATGASSYSWTPATGLSNSSIANPVAQPAVTTTYQVIGTDATGCSAIDSITIAVNPLPDIEAMAESNFISCNGKGVKLHATGAQTYSWQPANLCDNSLSADPLVKPDKETYFSVTGTDANGCKNADSVKVTVAKQNIFFVPNAFSPNNDGVNDLFQPKIYCGLTMKLFSIYNRYGERVYLSSNNAEGWDGTYGNQGADAGAYFWYIEGKDEFGGTFVKKGDVTLIR
jgi:gliding motility-associated-like protein